MSSILQKMKARNIQRDENAQKQPAAQEPIQQTIQRWLGNRTDKQSASKILKYLQPTINSALTSYAAGFERELRVPAAKLALQALQNYDPAKKVSPTTYVFHNLKRLNRLRADREQIVHQPENRRMAHADISQKIAQYQDMYGREPSQEQLADLTGLSMKKLDQLQSQNNMMVSQTSTNSPQTHDSSFSMPDTTDREYYDYVYKSVSPTDQKIMEWSSGFNKGNKILSNNDIATKLRISPPAVSQRRAKIQDMLSQVRGLL